MSKQLIVDERRNFAFDLSDNSIQIMESFGEQKICESVALVEFADDDSGREILVPTIIPMVEGISHNYREYTAKAMKGGKSNTQGWPSGVASFTMPIGRPILINHSVEPTAPFGPIVGRIRKAQFVPEGRVKNGVPGEERAHIKVWPEISDPMAVEYVKSGRFESTSIYVSTKEMVCSVCKKDLYKQMTNIVTKAKKAGKRGEAFQETISEMLVDVADTDEMCTHIPGMAYDNKLCYFTVGPFWDKEVSFVPIPGIDAARVIDRGIKESAPARHFWPSVGFIEDDDFLQYDSGLILVKESFEIPDNKEVEPMNPKNKFKGTEWEGWTEEDQKMVDELEAQITDQLIKDGYFESDEAAYMLEDLDEKKLTTAARNKMKSSTFCGPDKSFPVPDCKHVAVAKTYLGRYKGPGDKNKILSCVNRKAKALGCSSSKDDKKKESDTVAEDIFEKVVNGETKVSELQLPELVKVATDAKSEFESLTKLYETELAEKDKEITGLVAEKDKLISERDTRIIELNELKESIRDKKIEDFKEAFGKELSEAQMGILDSLPIEEVEKFTELLIVGALSNTECLTPDNPGAGKEGTTKLGDPPAIKPGTTIRSKRLENLIIR